jgi:quinol monooxygenase YgiN
VRSASPTRLRYDRAETPIVHVHAHVKPEYVEAFRAAPVENTRHCVAEPGILRVDIIQQADDPARFVLAEIYRTVEATRGSRREGEWSTNR